jgi:3,4-dihydroxy 2-butanone 4-phosphate synthase
MGVSYPPGYAPAAVVCEMLDDEIGGARSKENVRQYAADNDFPFLDGTDIVAWLG